MTPARVLAAAVSATLGATAVAGVPWLLGTSWDGVLTVLAGVGLTGLLVLTALWVGGLLVWSTVVTASFPGLGARRALALNLSGSSVANVFPLGGAAGIGLNLAMVRSWGLPIGALASSTVVLNVLTLASKLVLPIVVGTVLLLGPAGAPGLGTIVAVCTIVLLITVVVLAAALGSARFAEAADRVLDRFTRSRDPRERAVTLRRDVLTALRRRGQAMAVGTVGYLLLQAALFVECVHLTQPGVPLVAVMAAFAAERVMTLVPLTPGGVGAAEAVAGGVLVTLGAAPGAAAGALVLYRLFVYLAEIPVGGAVFVGWAMRRPAAPPVSSRRRAAWAASRIPHRVRPARASARRRCRTSASSTSAPDNRPG